MLKDIYEIKLSRNDLDVSCYVGSQGTVMRFDKRDVAKICGYFAEYGIILKDVGRGGSGNGDGTWEHYIILQFPQFTSILIEKRYIILAIPYTTPYEAGCGVGTAMVKLILREEPLTITSDKFGVALKVSEKGTFTKEECTRRGFDPKICQWLLKPELRDNEEPYLWENLDG